MNKSDFEINKAVAEKLDVRVYERSAGMLFTATEHRGEYNFTKFDPCNDPADAMPIIIENGIGLLPYKKSPPLAFDLKKGLGFGILVENENIYRAAMEVFLEMNK